MSPFDLVCDMYDVALKPRLLRKLLSENLPDEKRPLQDTRVLERVIWAVKTHKLLSESIVDSNDNKHAKAWRSAVSAWIDRVLLLVSSDSPTKCWVGVSLLGLTCQECSSELFLEGYPAWIEKLQAHIEPATKSLLVKVASCASLADLFLRLGQYPANHGKGSFAEKLVQLSLHLLTEDHSEVIWDAVLHLIGVMVTLFPSAVQRHYESAESTIISRILSGKCSKFLLEKLTRCLAILPKAKGDEGTWSLLMQRILLFVNDYLKDAFEGLEEKIKSHECIRQLAPPGKDPPLLLANYKSKGANWREQLYVVSAMLICCSEMLKNSYSAQVSIPVRSLVALSERVLTVDGAFPEILSSYVTTMQQETLCSGLPLLHSSVLDLLIALIKAMRSQILPQAAYIVQVITRYFGKCRVLGLRMKVYSVIKTLLMFMGAGMAKKLEHEIMRNVLVDLKPTHEKKITPSNKQLNPDKASAEPPKRRKKKKSSMNKHQEELGDLKYHTVENPEIKIAALETMEALFTVAGNVKFEGVDIDDFLISLVTFDHQTTSMEELQLAALRAILASILSQTHQRPPHVARILKLFRRGREVAGSKVGEFCAHSMLALEAIIHPRALPLSDYWTTPPVGSFGQKYPDLGTYINESDGFFMGAQSFDTTKSTNHGQDTAFINGSSDQNPQRKKKMLTSPSSDEISQKKKNLSNDSSHGKSRRKKKRPSNDSLDAESQRKKKSSNGSRDENSQRNDEKRPLVMVSTNKVMDSPETSKPPMNEPQEPSSPAAPILTPHTSITSEETREEVHEDKDVVEETREDMHGDKGVVEETREELHEDETVVHMDTYLSAIDGAAAASPNLDSKEPLPLHDTDHDDSDDDAFPDIICISPDSSDVEY
ncbi:hypothetical protein SAY87_006934 [Trapa incisa]|uniref:Pre-rRNA-processing protein RIX1 N-terminal domain-containing protein n=1 Tax=Trapa incisa TaxID=236973 RepID=A0AAN7K0F6_9MYRT|nr:hypothetical protein SAY87_006934 [Trapa incisa]